MVARLEPVRSISKPIAYNEEKVQQGKAECIHIGNFLQDKNNITYEEKLHRFQHLNELNTRSKVKMLHATLNFHPTEKLSNEQLAEISDRYMQGLQMEDHPYLVYRHHDSNHLHIHIVTSLIRDDGTRVNTHRMANRLSEPTRKAIEQEFDLIPSRRQAPTQGPVPDHVPKVVAGSPVPVTEAMERVIACVNQHYHFFNLQEYNAILRGYNITAETGSPGSKTQRYNGLYYVALDDQGNRTSPPVMASQLPSRATQNRLNEKYRECLTQRTDHLKSIKSRIDWALDQEPASLRTLVSQLQRDGIEIVRPPSNGRNSHDQVFVDYRTRTAVTGETLGPGYTTAAITAAIASHQRPAQQKRQEMKIQQDIRYSANFPQVLSAVLHTDPASADVIGQDKHLGYRHKR